MINDLVYARALPESVSLKETYHYELEISRNSSTQLSKPPAGLIEITVPYDGARYFSRRACGDVERQLGGANPARDVDAQIGHLHFAGYGGTDLDKVLDLANHYDTLPIRVPVVCDGLLRPEQLYDDQSAAQISYAYAPAAPEVIPAQLTAELMDEEQFAIPDRLDWDALAKRLARQASFEDTLALSLQVRLALPEQLAAACRIVKVTLGWPTITSLRTLRLAVGGQAAPVRYEPAKASIEWKNVPLAAQGEPRAGLQAYAAPPMWLQIGHPGELYRQAELSGNIELELQGALLSDLQLRLFDGAGAQVKRFAPERTTTIHLKFRLILDDAFAQRPLSPYQSLVFDELVPDDLRLFDIENALRDYGFRIEDQQADQLPLGALRYLIKAKRMEGPAELRLWVLVDGEPYATDRQTELPGGQLYTSTFVSGDLRVHMLGSLPGNARELTRVMNAIHAALSDRFARLRAKS